MRENLSFMPDVKALEPSALPEGCTAGLSFTTIALDTPNYLPWLAQRFRAAGGTVVRRELGKLTDAPLDDFDAVVNCSGLGALTLVGDDSMYPIRGQTVLVRAPWIRSGITRSGSDNWSALSVRCRADRAAYIIPRKQGDVIVGGTRGINDWSVGAPGSTDAAGTSSLGPRRRRRSSRAASSCAPRCCPRRSERRCASRTSTSWSTAGPSRCVAHADLAAASARRAKAAFALSSTTSRRPTVGHCRSCTTTVTLAPASRCRSARRLALWICCGLRSRRERRACSVLAS